MIQALLVVTMIILATTSNTAATKVNSSFQFTSKNIPTNERVDYKITALNEKSSGKASISVKKIVQMDTDMFLIRYEATEGENKEKWEVRVKKDDLSPVGYEKTIEKKEYSATMSGTFHGTSMTLTTRATDQEPKEKILSRASKFYISLIMPLLLRNVDFKTNDYYTFSMLLVDEGQFTTPIIQVKEKEVLDVPAGTYECWKLNIKIGSEQHYAWYSVKPPYYLVRYQYPNKELIMEKHS